MGDITFMCPECNESLSVDESFAGQEGGCPHCGKQIVIPATTKTGAHHSNTAPCPFCGEEIIAAALKCKHCGKAIVGGGKSRLGKSAPTKDNSGGNAACRGKSQSNGALSAKRIIQGCLVGVVLSGLVVFGLLKFYGNKVYVTQTGTTYHTDPNFLSLMHSTRVKSANSLICLVRGLRECRACQMLPKKRSAYTNNKARSDSENMVTDPIKDYAEASPGSMNEDKVGVIANIEGATKTRKVTEPQNGPAPNAVELENFNGDGVAQNNVEAIQPITPSSNLVASSFHPEQALVIIQTDSSQGTGFIASIGGTNYIITNTHVLCPPPSFSCYTVAGQVLDTGAIQFENHNDMARVQVNNFNGIPFNIRTDSDPLINEKITVYGNSGGAGVVTEISGQILGMGPTEVEVSAEFVEGNSGSPIVDKSGLVIGVATYATQDEPTFVSKNTRFAKARRMGIRLNTFNNEWVDVSLSRVHKQWAMLMDINTMISHFVDVKELMFTQKERRIEKLTARSYLKIRETKWFDIGYTDNPSGFYQTREWYALLKEICDIHDELTQVRYEGKISMRSHQMRLLMSQFDKSLQNIQQQPRIAISSTPWVTEFYKLCGMDMLERMPEVDKCVREISGHFDTDWN